MTDRLAQSRKHWDDLGRLDPFHAILSKPGTRFGRWDLDEFFATGQREIAELMESAARIGIPKRRNRALDFGCGMGRLTLPLGEYFEECIGVDISDSMIRQAQELCKSARCHFLLNDRPTLPFPNEDFDLIYTSIVLQHVPQKALIRGYISEFVRTLRKDGLLVMQIPSHIKLRNRLQPKRRLYEFLRGVGVSESYLYQTLRLTPMLMNFLPEREVFRVVETAGGRMLPSVPDELAPYKRASHIASRIYYVTK